MLVFSDSMSLNQAAAPFSPEPDDKVIAQSLEDRLYIEPNFLQNQKKVYCQVRFYIQGICFGEIDA